MIATLIGSVFIVLGFWGILIWFPDFLTVIRGFLPVSLIAGGIIAIASGLGSLRKKRKNDKTKE